MIQFDSWALDETRVVHGPDRNVRLARGEYAVLLALSNRPNQVISSEKLLDSIPPRDASENGRELTAITVIMHRLRRKLHRAGVHDNIGNVFGEGYLLREKAPMTRMDFTPSQMTALKMALSIAERYQPGIREKTGIIA